MLYCDLIFAKFSLKSTRPIFNKFKYRITLFIINICPFSFCYLIFIINAFQYNFSNLAFNPISFGHGFLY